MPSRFYKQSAKVDFDLWPCNPKPKGFLLSSSTMCMGSLKVIGQKLYSVSCPQGFKHRVPKLTLTFDLKSIGFPPSPSTSACEVWRWSGKSCSLYRDHKVKRDQQTHGLTHEPTHSPNHTRTVALLYPLQRCCEGIMNTVLVRYGHPIRNKQKHALNADKSMSTLSFNDSAIRSAFFRRQVAEWRRIAFVYYVIGNKAGSNRRWC